MNIKTKKSILTLYTVAATVLGVIFAAWRTVLLKQNYDPYDGTFELGSGDILRTFEYFLIFASILILTACFFAKNISFEKFSSSYSNTSLYVCLVCGIIFTAVGIFSLFYYFDDLFFKTRNNTFATKICTIIAFFLIFFVAAYFFMCASQKYKQKQIKVVFSLLIPVFTILCIIASYFNSDFVYNDFNRITCHISLLAILFFSLSEASLSLGRAAHKFNFISSLLCIICVPAYIIPLVGLAAFWEVNFTFTLLFEMSQIAFLIYAFASAISAINSLSEAPAVDKAE